MTEILYVINNRNRIFKLLARETNFKTKESIMNKVKICAHVSDEEIKRKT